MSIKGYELMKLAKENKEKYSRKTFKVVNGSARNFQGVAFDEININDLGHFESDHGDSIYVSVLTELEEIKQPVTPQEAAKAFEEGKLIVCKTETLTYSFRKNESWRTFTAECFIKCINGTWYIEE